MRKSLFYKLSLLFSVLAVLSSCQAAKQSDEASSVQSEYRFGEFLEHGDNHGLYTGMSFSWARVRGFACTYEVPELTAGSVVLHDFAFRLLDDEFTDETLEKDMSGYGIDMILGQDFFKQCRLTIDYKDHQCWIETGKSADYFY